ncbi:MAG: hypothetical protein A2W23_06155 [Planctomycetes bacterium RBG_16_43_13]|nr:MAG: hypothetical protein A2W23_06155 [Planctomycetes bacterium RBG_16_43_13]
MIVTADIAYIIKRMLNNEISNDEVANWVLDVLDEVLLSDNLLTEAKEIVKEIGMCNMPQFELTDEELKKFLIRLGYPV